MGIAALGMALAYLILVFAGAIGALLILLWLFRDSPGTIEKKTGRGKVECSAKRRALGTGRRVLGFDRAQALGRRGRVR